MSITNRDALKNDRGQAIGRHLLLDLRGVNDERLQDADALAQLLVSLLEQCGFHQLGVRQHQFPGPNAGATAMVLLSESHASIHTYPEHQYAALDVFSCGDADLDQFVDQIVAELQPRQIERSEHVRGRGLRP